MLPPDEAKELGLIDEVVPRHKLQAAAEAAMREMLKTPDHSRAVGGSAGLGWAGCWIASHLQDTAWCARGAVGA